MPGSPGGLYKEAADRQQKFPRRFSLGKVPVGAGPALRDSGEPQGKRESAFAQRSDPEGLVVVAGRAAARDLVPAQESVGAKKQRRRFLLKTPRTIL